MLIIVANSGNDSHSAATSGLTGSGSSPGESGSGYTPVPAYTPPVSKVLDEKNGFKDFKFGMTPEEAQAVMPPTDTAGQPGANVTNFNYRATSANRIGDFSADVLSLSFFEGLLYRIDLRFSNFQNEILEAFKVNFGEPFDTDSWKRGDQPLRAKAWQGNKVSAAILAMPGQPWDSAVIYDMEANKKAQEYAAKEPERAAKHFGTNGFKTLVMGMPLQDVTLDFKVVQDDQAAGVKKVVFKNDLEARRNKA